MLKTNILQAISSAKKALQDLTIDAKLISKTPLPYTPGSAPTYSVTEIDVSVVITSLQSSEIDGDRIRASDYRGLVFPGSAIPEPNDEIVAGTAHYRVVENRKVMVGDQVGLSQLVLRPT